MDFFCVCFNNVRLDFNMSSDWTPAQVNAAVDLLQLELKKLRPVHILVTMKGCGHCVKQCEEIAEAKYGNDGSFVQLPLEMVPVVAFKLHTKYPDLSRELEKAAAFPAHLWVMPSCQCILVHAGRMSVDDIRTFPKTHHIACDRKTKMPFHHALAAPLGSQRG